MTSSINYLSQLKDSSTSLRLSVPNMISQAVVEKIALIEERSTTDLPENIIYSQSSDKDRFHSTVHLANVRLSGWQLEILRATKKSVDEEVLVAVINKVGACKMKNPSSDHRNGNNHMRNKVMRK